MTEKCKNCGHETCKWRGKYYHVVIWHNVPTLYKKCYNVGGLEKIYDGCHARGVEPENRCGCTNPVPVEGKE